jgi:nucleoside 2-deoxyribosyltransferase
MSQANPFRVFVTHNWHDSDDYVRVFEYLESARNFFYRNTSTPDQLPSATDTESVRADLRKQIDAAEIVVALASLHQATPDLTIFQMNYAQSQKKPVLLMGFFGTRQEVPKVLQERSDEVGAWEDRAMVDAIRRLARQENTARFDSVDFNPDDFKDFKLT